MNWRIFKGHLRMLRRVQENIGTGQKSLQSGVGAQFLPGRVPDAFDFNRSAGQFAEMLADFSGRGPIPDNLKAVSPILNGLAFSLRTNVGRLLTPRHLWASDKFVRQAAWKNMLTGVGSIAGLIYAGHSLGWWRTEFDSRSSDFLKIIMGNTRVDPWGGYQRYAVLFARLLTSFTDENFKSVKSGQLSKRDPITDLIPRFARGLAAPALSQIYMAWVGEDWIGREIDRTDWKFWIEQNTQLAVQDIIEVYEEEGLLGLPAGIAGIYGAGIQVIKDEDSTPSPGGFGFEIE